MRTWAIYRSRFPFQHPTCLGYVDAENRSGAELAARALHGRGLILQLQPTLAKPQPASAPVRVVPPPRGTP